MRLILPIFLAVIAAWATWPGSNGINYNSCEPDGFFSQVSLSIYGNDFWQSQLEYTRRRIKDVESSLIENERLKLAAQSSVKQKEQLYRKYPDVAPKGAQLEAEELRDRADEIESAEGFKFMDDFYLGFLAKLRECERKIGARLR